MLAKCILSMDSLSKVRESQEETEIHFKVYIWYFLKAVFHHGAVVQSIKSIAEKWEEI